MHKKAARRGVMSKNKEINTPKIKNYSTVVLIILLVFIVALIVQMAYAIKQGRYEERKNYLSTIVSNSATIVSEKFKANRQIAYTLKSFLGTNHYYSSDPMEYIKLVKKDLGYDDFIIEIVNNEGYSYSSNGDRGKVSEINNYTPSSADSLMYISNGKSIHGSELYICLRERLEAPLLIGNDVIEYCNLQVPFDEVKNIISSYFTAAANTILVDQETGNMLYADFSAGEMMPGTNIYSKYNNAKYSHGESAEGLIAAAKSGQTVVSELSNDSANFFVCVSKIVDTPWLYCFVAESNSLSINSEDRDTSIFLYVVAIFIILSAISIIVIVIISRRNTEKKIYLAEKDLNEALKEALKMADSANRAKTHFLNSMSHDIRTPMNAIIGFTGLAKTHLNDAEAVSGYLSKIEHSSGFLLSLINDILEMSRIESGKVVINEEPARLSDILTTLKSIVVGDAEAKQLSFEINTDGIINDDILCDKLRLNQILLNVVSNAIKYTPAGGVKLTATQKERDEAGCSVYEIRVKDTGIGMTPEFAATVFEAFTRENSSTVSGIQGTGLGMAITKNVVDMMNGSIACESEKDKGTEFIIRLPLKINDNASAIKQDEAATSDVQPGNESFEGKRILLAEDNELNQEIAIMLLEDVGLIVECAVNGQEACELLKEKGAGYFDLVLMDVQMPIMDGYQATRTIREFEDEALSRTPIVAMTANAFEEDRKAAFDAGMDEYIAKPIDIRRVLEVLDRFL